MNYLEYIIQDIEIWLGILPAPKETVPVSSPGTSTTITISPTDTTSSTVSTASTSPTDTTLVTNVTNNVIDSYPQLISFSMEINAYFSQNPQNPLVATQLSFGNITENLATPNNPWPWWTAYIATDNTFNHIIASTTVALDHGVNGQQFYTHSMTSQEFNAAAIAGTLKLSSVTQTTAGIPLYVMIVDTVNHAKSNIVGLSLAYYGPGSFQNGWTGWAFSGGFGWY